MARTVYSDEQKQTALDLLETENIWAACTATGASHVTIYRWHAAHVRSLLKDNPELAAAEESEQRILRTRFQRRLLDIAMAHAERSDAARDGTQALRYMTAAAIAHDKYRLEMGESTGRTEIMAPIDMELGRIVDEFKRQSA